MAGLRKEGILQVKDTDGSSIGTVDQGSAGVEAWPVSIEDPVTIQEPLTVTGPLTDTELRALPVAVSGTGIGVTGPLTDSELRAAPIIVIAV
jgi:hypothetical protein